MRQQGLKRRLCKTNNSFKKKTYKNTKQTSLNKTILIYSIFILRLSQKHIGGDFYDHVRVFVKSIVLYARELKAFFDKISIIRIFFSLNTTNRKYQIYFLKRCILVPFNRFLAFIFMSISYETTLIFDIRWMNSLMAAVCYYAR